MDLLCIVILNNCDCAFVFVVSGYFWYTGLCRVVNWYLEGISYRIMKLVRSLAAPFLLPHCLTQYGVKATCTCVLVVFMQYVSWPPGTKFTNCFSFAPHASSPDKSLNLPLETRPRPSCKSVVFIKVVISPTFYINACLVVEHLILQLSWNSVLCISYYVYYK